MCPLPLELPSHFPPHPTPLDGQRAQGWAPCVTQEIPTGIYYTYGNVYVSIVLPQFVPPSPSPTVSTCLVFYVCISATPLQIGSSVPSFYIPYICVNTWYLFFRWFTSLCITSKFHYFFIWKSSCFSLTFHTHSHYFFQHIDHLTPKLLTYFIPSLMIAILCLGISSPQVLFQATHLLSFSSAYPHHLTE